MAYVPIDRPTRLASDLTVAHLEDADINLLDLYVAVVGGIQPGLIQGRTFRNCRLQGPATLLISAGVTFKDTNFGDSGGDMRNLLLKPMGQRALGTIPLRDCHFDNCAFIYVSFTGPEAVLNDLASVPVAGSAT
jgi:hypothetical protein